MAVKKRNLSSIDEEVKRKVLSDYEGDQLMTVVNQDQEYEYYFAAKRTDHPQSVDALKRVGYEVVDGSNNSGEQVPMGVVQTTEGGALQTAENVLMRIPKDWAELRRQKHEEITRQRTGSTKEEFEEMLAKVEESAGRERRTFIFGSGAGRYGGRD